MSILRCLKEVRTVHDEVRDPNSWGRQAAVM